jgi:AGCS family alanine or glycine:cation symporter
MEQVLDYAAAFNAVLWGPWTMALFVSAAVYLTVRSRFFQLRKIPFILTSTFGKILDNTFAGDPKKMTPFQAVTTSLAGTVGMGNIAGVATGLSVGGPGALFWMWVIAFFGMMTKTAEITLGVHYRDVDEAGNARGGPMFYIRKGLGWVTLSKTYSVGMLVACALSTTLLQSHTVGRAFLASYDLNPYIITTLMAVVTGIVVIGGTKRVGQFCMGVVPFMSIVYIVGGVLVIVANYDRLPDVINLILEYAFAPAPAAGGFVGAAVATTIRSGLSRGMLSNEAGQGTASMAHATTNTDHPFQEGVWGAFEVFIDTIIICSITGFAVLSSGVFGNGETGVELVISAFAHVFSPEVAGAILSFSILTFCLSTQIGFFVYYETAIRDLFGAGAMRIAKWLYLMPGIAFAGVAHVDKLWVFADISVGVSSIPNVIGILALSGAFFELMKDRLSGRNQYTTRLIDDNRQYVRTPRK